MNAPARPTPRLSELRECFDGIVPATLCTCSADGMPNTAYISQVFYVDEGHVALSFQFFNKTRENVLANPRAVVLLIEPSTAAQWRLHIRYLRTDHGGPVFEAMKAQLAGIASHAGMDGVFQLRGSDIYHVDRIDAVPGFALPAPPAPAGRIGALRCASERLARAGSLEEALDIVLDTLTGVLGLEHAMVLLHDPAQDRLYTVASRGYATSGVGSEIRLGQGVVGVCARERTPVRIGHMVNAALYGQAMRSSLADSGGGHEAAMEIPYPGLQRPHSQLAVPMLCAGVLRGVLFVESAQELRFTHGDEDLLVVIAGHLAAAMDALRAVPESAATPAPAPPTVPRSGARPLQLRRFRSNDSVFVNGSYLIKGVAGAILWKLLNDFRTSGRVEFSNRELRLNPSIGLPDFHDNLEARLILLQRRLEEQACGLALVKTGRGRFRLDVAAAIELLEADQATGAGAG